MTLVWVFAAVASVFVAGCVAGAISWWRNRRRLARGFSHNHNGPRP